MKNTINTQLVKHIAQLAAIPITPREEKELVVAFNQTLKVVDQLQEVAVQDVEPTHQVTGLENVTRQDKVSPESMFTQAQALANARRQHQGFFVVDRVIDQE